MHDREKVIKGLEAIVNDDWMWKNAGYCAGICKEALAMLKAQEPMEPVVDKNTSTGECEDPWGRLFFCGACGKRINEKYDPDEDDKYCKHCGRAVKWDERE